MSPHILVPYNHPESDKRLYQTGGFSVQRRRLWEKFPWNGDIPIWNEKNGGINEDIELAARLHDAGITFKFDPENTTWHWDDNYTEVKDQYGNSLSLLKSMIRENVGDVDFPPSCDEFETLLMTLGVNA